MNVERKFANKKEAAEIIGISVSSIQRRIADGTIMARKIGGRVFVPISELERLASVQE